MSYSSATRWGRVASRLGITLHDIDHTPLFLHTPHITTHYRVRLPLRSCLLSLWSPHNEWLNIWTHLLGSLLIVVLAALPLFDFGTPSNSASFCWIDSLLLTLFHLSALFCLGASTLYHWFGCMSVQAHSCLYIGDMSSIGVLIMGSYLPGLYFAFICRPIAQIVYMSAIASLVLAYFILYQVDQCHKRRIAALTSNHLLQHCVRFAAHTQELEEEEGEEEEETSKFESARQQMHWARVSLLVLMVASALMPAFHFMMIADVDHPRINKWKVLQPVFQMLALYAIGFAFYVSHCPERLFPRTFDVLGGSHSIWHTCIVFAIVVWHYHLNALLELKPLAKCYESV